MYNDDFSDYIAAKEHGMNARSAYELAEKNGLDNLARIRMLIHVFGLTIGEAKEVSILDVSSSLEEHQEKLLPALEKAAELGLFDDVVNGKDIEIVRPENSHDVESKNSNDQ